MHGKTSLWKQSSCAVVRSRSSSIWIFLVPRMGRITVRLLRRTIRFTPRPEGAEPPRVTAARPANRWKPSMLDSKYALHPAKTLVAICVCGERDLHAGQRYELRRRGLDDPAAHSLGDGFRDVCRAADDSR